jgi:hypothetical protein
MKGYNGPDKSVLTRVHQSSHYQSHVLFVILLKRTEEALKCNLKKVEYLDNFTSILQWFKYTSLKLTGMLFIRIK